MAHQLDDGGQDTSTVAHGVQLRETTLRAVPVLDRDLNDAETLVERMESHIDFDLEAADHDRVVGDEVPAHRPIAAHDVAEARVEHPVHQHAHKIVTRTMEPSPVLAGV